MENGLQIFSNKEFGQVRTLLIDDEPWFVGKDVASALKYGKGKSLNNAVANHVMDEDRGVTEIMTPGGKQKMVIINESGLYAMIFGSRLESAKRFKHWVTSEVLPSIRKTGKYEYKKKQPTSLELVNQMVNALNEQNKKMEEFEQELDSVNDEIKEINRKIDVIGAYQNSSMYSRLRGLCSSRVMTLLSNDIYRVLWSPYFYKAIHISLAKYFNVANTKLIQTGDLEEAKNFIINWRPSDHYIQQKTKDLIKKRDTGDLKENRVMALKIWLMDTDNGKNNPF